VSLPRSHLEQIGDKLEQAEAILAYNGGSSHRLAAVRALLSPLGSAVMPSLSMRKRWVGIVETMLRLKHDMATADEVADLSRQIVDLRRAVRAHEVHISL
jgi:hypothetical protein